MGILRPRSDRNPESLGHDTLIPGLTHVSLQFVARIGIPSEIVNRLQQRLDPLADRPIVRQGPVLGIVRDVEVLDLGPSARVDELEGLVDQPRPVDDRRGHVAHVDEVEEFLKRPRLFAVVDLEFHVGRHPATALLATLPATPLLLWRKERRTSSVAWD